MVCEGCFEEENKFLKANIRYRERSEQNGFLGFSTPSSKVPVKSNSFEENQKKLGGAKTGHSGYGRRGLEINQTDRVVEYNFSLRQGCGKIGT